MKSCPAFGKTPEEALREVQLAKSAAQRNVPARFWISIVGVVHGLTLDRSPNLGLVRVLERAIKEAKADLRPSDWE